jgi:hypothetical protein
VFFAQNNLSFLALQHMSNAAFQLLLNMRIVAVALLTVQWRWRGGVMVVRGGDGGWWWWRW